ncbi:hypothetical protein ZHAS_00006953 [Anopheles sinensis]|uniref:Uncharacterized protein n=1 Tax=Anopheles sinensis TaxID=74873 RepID=A0A084VNB6_ANOSI|nr:hypothetical protein ZHAS_00006953 [Anopheles sinensis]
MKRYIILVAGGRLALLVEQRKRSRVGSHNSTRHSVPCCAVEAIGCLVADAESYFPPRAYLYEKSNKPEVLVPLPAPEAEERNLTIDIGRGTSEALLTSGLWEIGFHRSKKAGGRVVK